MSIWVDVSPIKSLKDNDFYEGRIVYGWRRIETYLYIGMSFIGSWRPFGNHHVIGKVEKRLEEDFIDIWHTNNPRELERELIKKLTPKYNGVLTEKICIRCNHRFETKEQVACCPPCLTFYRTNNITKFNKYRAIPKSREFKRYLAGEQ